MLSQELRDKIRDYALKEWQTYAFMSHEDLEASIREFVESLNEPDKPSPKPPRGHSGVVPGYSKTEINIDLPLFSINRIYSD